MVGLFGGVWGDCSGWSAILFVVVGPGSVARHLGFIVNFVDVVGRTNQSWEAPRASDADRNPHEVLVSLHCLELLSALMLTL